MGFAPQAILLQPEAALSSVERAIAINLKCLANHSLIMAIISPLSVMS